MPALTLAKALPDKVRPPTRRAASTSPTCRWSRSTARTRATSTTRCTASRPRSAAARAGACWSRSPTSATMCETGTAIDVDAYDRATSVYFPRRVIPMLPEKLSNGLCSLNPEVERLCMVCDMLVAADGEIYAYQFYPAVMWSHARFTYTEVAAILAQHARPGGAEAQGPGARTCCICMTSIARCSSSAASAARSTSRPPRRRSSATTTGASRRSCRAPATRPIA